MLSMNRAHRSEYRNLSMDDLRRTVPSVFTKEAYEKTSDKYKLISTDQIIQGMMNEGFMPVAARQSRTKIEGKAPYTKHMIRFRHVNTEVKLTQFGELFPEIVLINSHDGGSSYRLMAGIFRLICENGLIAGEKYDEVKVR